VVHADHAKSHVAKGVKQYLDENGLRSAPHPRQSPELAPTDFFFFGHVKRTLQGTKFQTAEGLVREFPEQNNVSKQCSFYEKLRFSKQYYVS
jgi:hypothetical protein